MKRILLILFLLFPIVNCQLSIVNSVLAQPKQFLILHTSDTHSCIEPLSPNFTVASFANKGGYVRRISLFNQLREQNPDAVLTFDCVDF